MMKPEERQPLEPVSDELLEAAAGGQVDNSTEIVYSSTYVPFGSSF